MKTIICVMLFVFCVPCTGQNIQNSDKNESAKVDTLSILRLRKQYGNRNYEVLRLSRLDSSNRATSKIKNIELITNNSVVASIRLPIANDEAKNFSVVKIAETRGGFKIVISWGGGNYFYHREYYFTFKENQVYFNRLRIDDYTLDPDEKTKRMKKISPPIPIDKFDMLQYLSRVP